MSATITKPGRLTYDGADFWAHEHDGFILLEPLTERARAEVERIAPDCCDETTGWLFAEWFDSPLEQAIAREIAAGWNARTFRMLDEEAFARMLAAILEGPDADFDDVTEQQWREALELATGRSVPRKLSPHRRPDCDLDGGSVRSRDGIPF